jgi:hypothetical protein
MNGLILLPWHRWNNPFLKKRGGIKNAIKDGEERAQRLVMVGFHVVVVGLKCLNPDAPGRKRDGVENRINRVNKLR